MHPFTVFFAALLLLGAASLVSGRSSDPRVKSLAGGLGFGFFLIAVACVAAGLWEAWSPWQVELTRR